MAAVTPARKGSLTGNCAQKFFCLLLLGTTRLSGRLIDIFATWQSACGERMTMPLDPFGPGYTTKRYAPGPNAAPAGTVEIGQASNTTKVGLFAVAACSRRMRREEEQSSPWWHASPSICRAHQQFVSGTRLV